jgi:hypothetical protein
VVQRKFWVQRFLAGLSITQQHLIKSRYQGIEEFIIPNICYG